MKQTYYFDMDGVLANFHKEPYNRSNACRRDWIANLDPFMDAVNTVKRLMQEGNEIYINSLAASEDAKLGKIDWLAKYLPELEKSHIIVIVGHGKKSDYMKVPGILVDDKASNCKQWEKLSGCPAVWVEERGVVRL